MLFWLQTFESTTNEFTHQSSVDLLSDSKQLALANEKSASLPRNMHSKAVPRTSTRQPYGQPRSLNGGTRAAHQSQGSKSEQMHERINQLQNSTAKAAIRLASHSQPQLNQDPGIVDGYLENVCKLLTFLHTPNLKLLEFFDRVPTCWNYNYRMRILWWQYPDWNSCNIWRCFANTFLGIRCMNYTKPWTALKR